MNQKKITRSLSDRVFAGICGGLGKYFDTDPVIFRIIFCVLAFMGAGILAYIVLIFIIPAEKNIYRSSAASGISEEQINEAKEQIFEVKEEIKEEVKKSANASFIVFGIILITIGFFFLLPNVHCRFLFPMILIICGILLLFFPKKKS